MPKCTVPCAAKVRTRLGASVLNRSYAPRPSLHSKPLRSPLSPHAQTADAWTTPIAASRLLSGVLGAGAAFLLLTASPGPALAQLETVTADQATSMAKPLKVQSVNKGRIWLVLILGASALFGGAVVLENNEQWFPAIARANKAMATSAQRAAQQEYAAEEEQLQFEERLVDVEKERQEDARLEDAVLSGLQEAKAQVGIAAPAAVAAVEAVAAAAEAELSPSEQYPAELDAHADSDEEEVAAPSEALDSDGEDAVGPEEETRTPVFEISGEQIEASSRNVARAALSELSLDDLQRELEARKAAAGSD